MILEMNPYYVINQIDIVIKRNKLLFPMASYDETEKLNNNIEALEVAKKAVEKQIAKKPTDYDGKIKVGFCPDCEAVVTSDFCDNCGQALDWSDS